MLLFIYHDWEFFEVYKFIHISSYQSDLCYTKVFIKFKLRVKYDLDYC